MLLLIDASSDSSSNDSDGVDIVLAVLLGISVIVLVISIVINVCFVVQRKQSRCIVTSVHSMYLQLTIYCRYDVNQSNIKYSEDEKSVLSDYAIKDSINVKSSDPEYEAVEIDHKPIDCDVTMDANPAYQATSNI